MFNRTGKTVTAFEAQSSDLAFDVRKAQEYADLSAQFAEHQRELQKITTRMDQLQNASRGGGFPWTLLLLAGGAVALYRSSEPVRTQVNGLLSRVMPKNNGEQNQSTPPEGGPQAAVGTSTPTVNVGVTPGQSGNEAYGMGTPSASSPTGSTGSILNNQGTSTPSMSKDNKSRS